MQQQKQTKQPLFFHPRPTNNLLQYYKLKSKMIGVLPTQITKEYASARKRMTKAN